MRCRTVYFSGVRTFETTHVTRILYQRYVHTQADTQIGNLVLAGELHRHNLAFYPAIPETARHQNRVHLGQNPGTIALNILGIDMGYLYVN